MRADPKPAKRKRDDRAMAVYLNENATCEVRGDWCKGIATQVHHRKLRSQGGSDTPDNFVAVCRDCHQHIHANPAWAYENGWLIHSWDCW